MARTINYTLLAFELNHLIDVGERTDIEETKGHIKAGDLFSFLVNSYKVDVSIFSDAEKDEMLTFFRSLYEQVDAGRKFGVKRDGFTLLLAYCIEWLQEQRADD